MLDHWTVQPGGRHADATRWTCSSCARPTATSRRRCATGRFRHDLYQRLKALTIRLTPAAHAAGRRPAAARALPGRGGEGPAEADARPHPRGAARAAGLRVAGQRARAGRACAGRSSRTRRPGAEIDLDDVAPPLPGGAGRARRTAPRFAERRGGGLLPRRARRVRARASSCSASSCTAGTCPRPRAAWASRRRRSTAICSATACRQEAARERCTVGDPPVRDALHQLCLADPVWAERYEGWTELGRGGSATRRAHVQPGRRRGHRAQDLPRTCCRRTSSASSRRCATRSG